MTVLIFILGFGLWMFLSAYFDKSMHYAPKAKLADKFQYINKPEMVIGSDEYYNKYMGKR